MRDTREMPFALQLARIHIIFNEWHIRQQPPQAPTGNTLAPFPRCNCSLTCLTASGNPVFCSSHQKPREVEEGRNDGPWSIRPRS